jgi:hypothetical protein
MSEWAERREEARRSAEAQYRARRKDRQKIGIPSEHGNDQHSEQPVASWEDASFHENGDNREVEIDFPDGSRFVGDCVPHAPSLIGNGRYFFPNGDAYVGYLSNGKLEGNGTLIYVNGDRYEGSFHDGKRHGIGRYTSVCGAEYFGEYRHGNRHGRGVFRNSQGDVYEGMFDGGKMTGKGKLVRSDGSEYEGDFVTSKYSGFGTLKK